MNRSWWSWMLLAVAFAAIAACVVFAQESAQSEQKKPPALSASSRLLAAKTVFIRQPRGNMIPFNVISSSLEGWGRYEIVHDELKADLIVETTAPQETNGFSVSSSTTVNAAGRQEQSSKSTKEFSKSPITMVVIDAKTRTPLWTASEMPKSGMRRKAQEDNQVEAAQELFRKFHDRVEPPLSE